MRWIVASILLASFLLSGCLGGGSQSSQPTDSLQIPPSSDLPDPSTPALPTEEPEDVFVPKFHAHNYWNGRPEVNLFTDFKLRIGEDVQKETKLVGQALIVGFRKFDTASNGEDANTADMADTVFQGTKELAFKVDWASDANINGLTFYYKSAAGPLDTAIPNIQKGVEYKIPVKKGMADMPHQLQLSRWRFTIEAFDPSQESNPTQVYVAKGEVIINMKMINGGETFIDPPHPYFFTGGPVRYAGEINQTLGTTVFANASAGTTPLQQTVGSPLSGWKIGNRHIIPWETTHLRAWLYYNYSGSADGLEHRLGLKFTDASGPDEKYPKAVRNDAGVASYEFAVSEAQTDSPYAQSSDWSWGVYPIVQGQEGPAGDFQGNVHVFVQAVKVGDTGGRGMGN